MSSIPTFLGLDELVDVLSQTKTATAIHVGTHAHIQFANDAMIEIWGKDREVIGKSLEEALPELRGQPFVEMFAKVWRDGLTISGSDTAAELMVDGKNTVFYFDFEYRAILNQNGKTICILHTAVDVTERFLKHSALKEAELAARTLAKEQELNEKLAVSNEKLSAAYKELRTINEEMQLTKDKLRLLNLELEKKISERTETISFLNQNLEASNEEIKASNEELAASNEELSATNEELSESRDNLASSLTDLAVSEQRTKSIIESAPFPIGIYIGSEMIIAFANKSIIEVWGKGTEVIGKQYSSILPELENQSVFKQLAMVYSTGVSFEARNQQIDLIVSGVSKTYYFNYNFTALRNEKGKIYGVMNTAADVTDLALATQQIEAAALEAVALNEKLAGANEEMAAMNEELTASNEEMVQSNQELSLLYEKLKISQDETELAIDAAGLGTFDLNPSTGYFSGNNLLKSWLGLAPEDEIKLERATEIILESDRERVKQSIDASLKFESGGKYESYYSIISPDHQKARIVKASGKTIFNKDKQPIRLSGVLQDVTEQINSRKEILEVNTRLQIAMDAGALGSTEVDLATGTMQCNDQFKRCFGRTKDEDFIYSDMFDAMLPTHRERIKQLVLIAKQNHSIYKAKYEIQWPDGSIHWISAHGQARYDNGGNAVKMVGVISDITEAKADEQRKNDFIGMVSHELKTPLTSLTGYIQLLLSKSRANGDEFAKNALDKANNQLGKMNNMINSFLNVSRLESGKIHIEQTFFDLSHLFEEVKSEFSVTNNSHHLIFESTPGLFINADRDKIGHVLNNLISNAVKYSPTGTEVVIFSHLFDGEVRVGVRDQGSGIKDEDKLKLFERYYRVINQPRTVSGFGIGLYLCAEIIQRHHGKIWTESLIDNGSTFYFSIPLRKRNEVEEDG